MRRFTQLIREIDESGSDRTKVAALRCYLDEAPAVDAAWALWLLRGNRLNLHISPRRLMQWANELAGFPDWLVDTCHTHVGNLAETAALLLPLAGREGATLPLHELIETRLLPLRNWDDRFQFQLLREFWLCRSRDEVFVLNKMLSGGLSLGVTDSMIARALEESLGIRDDPEWWEGKAVAHSADLVLVYARASQGRGGSGFADYTLAARDGDAFVPVAKVSSGLTGHEVREIADWINAHTLARRGPVRTVPAELVFEIGFDGLEASTRHKAGLTPREPRILRWRRDMPVAEIDSLESLRKQME
jgi:hypothetical protein